MPIPENTEREWRYERFEVVGYGRRFGTSPLGGQASGWHLGSTSFPLSTAAVDLNCSAAWSTDAEPTGTWTSV